MTPLSHIRNFAIIAHIDHGKSTLADRLIQACGGLEAREMREQVLDMMELERERGITIKAQTVRLDYRARNGEDYVLNLMDTPGHVDFAYEVSRSLAACEGSLLVVDASQGVERVGVFTPKGVAVPALGRGEMGFIAAGIKTVADCRVGDTITEDRRPAAQMLPGFKPVQPVVFCGLFPMDSADYERLRDSLAKLGLNDASFIYEPETSAALGFGFRCGFLRLLHLEIIQERLEREFDLDLITTAPSIVSRVYQNSGGVLYLLNPLNIPYTFKTGLN